MLVCPYYADVHGFNTYWSEFLANTVSVSRPALSNQNDLCRPIRHFCGNKVFAVDTIWRNMLLNKNLVNILIMKPFLENLPVATFKWPVAACGE